MKSEKTEKIEKDSWQTFKKVSKYVLPICLILVIGISILITVLTLRKKKTAKEIVNEMGIGWNLGNTFDCYVKSKKFNSPDEQITAWGNIIPTKEMILKIKKYGFKTIRLPVTWMHFIDESGNVNSDWMSRVKEVTKWIIKDKMYCILNVHHDGVTGNWLSEGMKVKNKYINLWSQIAEEFKNFNDYLIFESMNEVEFLLGDKHDFLTLLNLNQLFIDTVRNSGGKNGDRLLLIAGMDGNADLTCSSEYSIPIDPINKYAVSFNYYIPERFTLELDSAPWTYVIDKVTYEVLPMTHWGEKGHYEEMLNNFENIKKAFLDKQIPVIINEVGVLTEEKKDSKSVREFLFSSFLLSIDYDGIMICLWDTSNKNYGDMNYYNRENNTWFDEKIKNNFKKISKGKYEKPKDNLLLQIQ
jgi:endoglucanase